MKHLIIKFVLVIVAGISSIQTVDFISKTVDYVNPSPLAYAICGAVLSYIVVVIYNRFLKKRREEEIKELKQLADITFKRFDNNP